MSQINSDSSRRSRRIRAGQKRPTLVTRENGYEGAETLEQSSSESASAVAVEEMTPPTTNPRRMKGFFTNIGKEKEETATDESEVTRARLARATRGKAAKSNQEQETTSKKVATAEKPAASAKAPARSGGFKLRHIIGLALYLVLSNLIGYAETAVMNTMGWDRQVANFNLFGQQITISTSTLVFLATLILILVVLARLDLLPTRMTSTQPARRKDGPSSYASVKREQVTVRQGEKGPDDELYQSYRQNQRREKKR